MTRWQHFLSAIRFRSPAIVIVRPERMSDEKIDEILKGTAETTPLYRAVLQLLEEAREEAIASEAQDAWNPTAMAMHSGGARYLKAVRDDVIRRRMGRKAKRG